MPLSSADLSRIHALGRKDRIWSTDFIIIEEEIFPDCKMEKYNSWFRPRLTGWARDRNSPAVPLNTKICKWGETRSCPHMTRSTQVPNDLSVPGASTAYRYALRQVLQVSFIMTWKQDEVWWAHWTSDLFNLSISISLINHFNARQEPGRLLFTSYM